MSDARSGGAGPLLRRVATAALGVALSVSVSVAAVVAPAGPSAARTPAADNPLLGEWGVYRGHHDGAYPAWQSATGNARDLLAKVALAPRARWYGTWIPRADVAERIRTEVLAEQDGDPDVLVPIAIFREFPWGEGHIDRPLRKADRVAYRRWIDAAAQGIGGRRVMVVLEPDLPLALKGWRPGVRLRLVSYAARILGDLPRTTVYLDAGAVDWLLDIGDAVSLLRRAGLEHVRGFAVGGTHYSGTAANVRYGVRIVEALREAGFPHRHFVVDTSDNGRPFTGVWYRRTHPGGDFNNAEPCRDDDQRRCVALGIPPTTDVAADRWGLPAEVRSLARRHVDAYVWYARPWLDRRKQHLDLERTLAIARYSPY